MHCVPVTLTLDALAGWPVPTAAGAVVVAGEVVESAGPTGWQTDIASVTKPLVALATLVAVEEGVLDLEAPAGPAGATIRHLLAHASGLPFDGREPLVPPGRRRIYSNTGFEVLGEQLASGAAMAPADYLTEAVLVPLGLRGTELRGSVAKDARSTVDDLAVFAAELLAPTLVAPATLADATSEQFPGLSGVLPGFGTQRPNDWGLGFEIRSGKSPHWTGSANSGGTYGHFGQSGTFLWVDPQAELALVALTDRDFGDWAYSRWPALSDGVLREFEAD